MRTRENQKWIARLPRLVALFALLGMMGLLGACASSGDRASDEQQAVGQSVPGQSTGQSAQRSTTGRLAAIGVQTERHLDVSLLTARQMFEGVGDYQADQVTIVACGPAVKSLLKGSGIEAELEKTRAKGDVRVVACGITLEQMKLDPDQLADGVEAVPNGFIELARLQALGYDAVVL